MVLLVGSRQQLKYYYFLQKLTQEVRSIFHDFLLEKASVRSFVKHRKVPIDRHSECRRISFYYILYACFFQTLALIAID